MFDNDFIALFPEIFLICATIVLLIYGVIYSDTTSDISKDAASESYHPIVRNVALLGFLSIFITIMLCAFGPCTTANLCYNSLIIDNFTFYFKIGLLVSTGCIILMSLQYFQQEALTAFESIILILMSTCSMLFMISAFDLIVLYLAIELQSLCFYVLAASKRNSEFSTEAGLKYFILGAFSSGILLFGCSLIYGFTGVTNLEELAKIFSLINIRPMGSEAVAVASLEAPTAAASQLLETSAQLSFAPSSGIFMGILFLAVGFLFKITAVPFHMWAPDVYEGSPTIVTAFFSVAPKIAILANMLRVFMFSFYDPTWQQLFVFCSVASMILGAFAALSQNKIKRLLAFSSIGHIGYLLIGFSCGTIEGIQSLLIGLFIYVFMTINIFTVILSLRQNGGTESSKQQLCLTHLHANEGGLPLAALLPETVSSFARFKYISDLGALAKTNPILALTISITMFSLAGIPPLAGFCSKFYLFFAALGCGAYLLALIGIITSVISCFYYIRLIKIMYFDTPKTWIFYKPMDREKSILLGISLFFITFFFLYPSPLFLMTHKMALSLCL